MKKAKPIVFGYFTDKELHMELADTPIAKSEYSEDTVGTYCEFLTKDHHLATVCLGAYGDYSIDVLNTVLSKLQSNLATETIWIIDNFVTENVPMEQVIPTIVLAREEMSYAFTKYKTKAVPNKQYVIDFFGADRQKIEKLTIKANILAQNIKLAKDLGNEPPNKLVPEALADIIAAFAEKQNLPYKRFSGREELAEIQAHALLAVNQGSRLQAELITVEYIGNPMSTDTIALVGKGITFDTGGYSLKAVTSIVSMKCDMCGASTAFAAFKTAVEYQLPINVVLAIASTDNLISAEAYKPDDIIETMNGKTVEIVSTDAEGRLILADTLTFVQRNYPITKIIDMATLTGAAVISLGEQVTAVFSNNDAACAEVVASAEKAKELVWRMPLLDIYTTGVRSSKVADLTNKPSDYGGHASYAAAFLKEFIENDIPWVHLDIAGPAYYKAAKYGKKAGTTGVMIKSLVQLLEDNQ